MRTGAVTPAQSGYDYSIPMRFGDLKFSVRLVPTLLLALPIPFFVALGLWQLDRAEQKREQAQVQRERSLMSPLELTGLVKDPEVLRFRRLVAHGVFEAEGQILIENRRQANRTGFHVLTPLRIDGSELRVLVNRGWIPAATDGSPTPAPVPVGSVRVTGESHIPAAPALAIHRGNEAAKEWGTRWPYLTLDLYAAAFGLPLQPVVILQAPEEAGGFERAWPREMPKEGMHVGYAIQWFAFALIALVLWLRLSLESRAKKGLAA